ncbi:5'-nucleotidase domain-containing protein 1 [Amblyraja radiata]|uniref:5'-nucleotidase domain-containing protein 1 n=1 Tax=Amblyraja radiata TaxID=386614 RepID=UPI001402062D|nr:5'-nucleotidase domain-containing protein 1 [Amblyraja radiata]
MARAEDFSLADCDVIGFDLDHTLCRYNVTATFALIYDSFAQYLVEQKGYDRELMTVTPDSWDFCFKGLLLDMEDGNLLKLSEDGTVVRASHGTRILTAEEILETYGKKRKWKHFKTINGVFARSGKYHFYDNYFDLPGALLCARVVDLLDQNRNVKKYEFWKDVIASIEYNYKASAFKEDSGIYFPSVKKDPGKYLLRCSESVKDWLRRLKNAGKVLLLITSSHSDYCRLLCEHILGEDFEEIFDIIITNALKPGFFTQIPQQRPFRTLVNDEEREPLPSLEQPGWYSQGNWSHLNELLKKITGKAEPKVVYFGDSMRSDIFPAHSYNNCETVLVLEELEVEASQQVTMDRQDSEPLEKKGKYEGPRDKMWPVVSARWGSYFVDRVTGLEGEGETQVHTWCSNNINTYSTIAIPSLQAIADLPLDHKFPRFCPGKPRFTGYYPRPPVPLVPGSSEPITQE